jgi:hypothetical protein
MNWCFAPEYGPANPSSRNRRMKSLRLQGFHWLMDWLPIQVDAVNDGQGVPQL